MTDPRKAAEWGAIVCPVSSIERTQMARNDLVALSSEQLNELVQVLPAKKRAPFSAALRAAEKYAKQTKDFEAAAKFAKAQLMNEWHLGKATLQIEKAAGNRFVDSDSNQNLTKTEVLSGLGVTAKRCSLAENLHGVLREVDEGKPKKRVGGFTEKQLESWASQATELPDKYPRIVNAVQEASRRASALLVPSDEDIEEEIIQGQYRVIVIDPPWPMEKIEREVAPTQTDFDYPTMKEIDLAEMTLPAAEDCHLWLWTTHKFLPMALRLVPKWGFRYVCTFVWHKPGGFQPIGLPQYNSEFALYCRKGSPEFADTKDFMTCFDAPRGKHSEKPEAFYDVVRRVCGLTRRRKGIDMFNRRKIDCFDTWGNEAQ